YLRTATGTTKLDDADPVGIGRERIFAVQDRVVYLARIAGIEQTALLVVLTGGSEQAAAAVAEPRFGVEIKIDVLGYADSSWHGRSPAPWRKQRSQQLDRRADSAGHCRNRQVTWTTLRG